MDNLIRIYDDAVPSDFCDSLVEKFEKSSDQWDVQSNTNYDFTQIDMGKHMKSWQGVCTLIEVLKSFQWLF